MGSRTLCDDYYSAFCPTDGSALEKMNAPRAITGGKKYSCPKCQSMYDENELKLVLDKDKVNLRMREIDDERKLLGKALDDSLRED